ncbi:iron-siderophore ABC transporter substrate-binding protein [Salibacterium salarium]|uniref:Iron-siderophore ABC transporter substrate-binding protein n=1 Tax=Salibacterium salarium TaxID=284579 RepID=A0A428N8K8_9BACI|nr:iron-siderophore ABC transporter substrate-binding protein [Salibacterium salarium]RSL34691.1 iron-siderophore ABC transporter substrate-binding protein [Salibacterium salarium]
MVYIRKIPLSVLLILAGLLIALVGCSSESSDTTPASTSAEDDSEKDEPTASQEAEEEDSIVIEHAFGETVLEEKPDRVATIQWGNHDTALALGVVPVGFSAANYGVTDENGLLPWTAEKVEELGEDDPNVFQDTDGLDFEAISDSNPDVILAAYSGITQEDYEILSDIAPVVAYPESPWTTSWRDQITMNAKGMGMEEEGEQLVQETEDLINEKASEYPGMEGKKVVWANFSADDLSEFHVYTPADSRGSFLTEELGMEYPESVKELIEDDSGFSLSISAENADVLNDADLIIGYGDESLQEAVQADPRLGQVPAIERGSVAFIGDGTVLAASGTPSALSIPYTIDDYLELIGDAISNIEE